MRWNFISERFFFFFAFISMPKTFLFVWAVSFWTIYPPAGCSMASYGRIEEFLPAQAGWITYAERLSYYFEAKNITDTIRKKAVCEMKTFSLLKDLITPDSLRDKTFDELSQEHCNLAPSVTVEQFNFYMCRQQPNHLRLYHPLKKIKFCKFGPTIQDMLRDLLIVGITDDRICRRLLAKKKSNFDQARQIALVMESADKNVHNIAACSNTTTLIQPNISRINSGNSSRGKSEKPCFRCDGKHSPDSCRFRGATCNFCQKTGHISAVCLKRKGTKSTRNRRTHEVDRNGHDDDTHSITSGDTASVHKLFCISQKKNWPSSGIGGHQRQMSRDGNLHRCCSITN